MAGDKSQGLILRDGSGSYYLLRREILEQHRLPPEQADAVEQVIGGDMQGFAAEPHFDPASPMPWQVFPLGSDLLDGITPLKQ